jgi:glutathionylspermidine synthase
MQRKIIVPRQNWQALLEQKGFGYHSLDTPYWDESAYYSFSLAEINEIEQATNTLYEMCLQAVQYVIDKNLFKQFAIPQWIVPYLIETWEQDAPSIYGRMDLGYDNENIKLFEFNADTPTSLFEASIIQWYWLQDVFTHKDQFNSVHEKLINYWTHLKPYLNNGLLHFTCVAESLEDLSNVEYLRDTAMQAGIDTKHLFIDELGADYEQRSFIDKQGLPITNLFKLYPWEWLTEDEFGKMILDEKQKIKWIEPAWKMILSNKALLPILWQMYPNHPNLLEASFTPISSTSYVKKPKLSREGANVTLVKNNNVEAFISGDYGKEGFIFQALMETPSFDGKRPVIGSWIIGQEAAGIGIRETDGLITDNTSRFVPHVIA